MLALVTIISLGAFLLLLMPSTMVGVAETAVIFALTAALMIWKKPWKQKPAWSKLSVVIALLIVLYFGFEFYNRWTFASVIHRAAAALHVTESVICVLAAVAAVVGVLCAGFFALGLVQQILKIICAQNEKNRTATDVFRCLIMSVTVVALTQIMSDADVLSMGYMKFLVGLLIVMSVMLLIYALSGNVKLSALLGTILFMIISTVNVYVYKFRGRLFEPVDIFSAGTAMNVADNYEFFPIPFPILAGWAIAAAMLVGIFRSCPKEKVKIPGKQRLWVAAGCLVSLVVVIFCSAGLETYQWENKGAVRNGFVFDFVAKIKDAYVQKPRGYSTDAISDMAEHYGQGGETAEKRPHIIVIMDEAFSDLGVVGELSTNQEVAPFISSLKENAVSGYALSSVHGGNTANSEFEFLTGNSMAWMSPNAVPYQQYIRSSAYSMVSYLKGMYDYNCVAVHPYRADGWNRPAVYNYMGFDESVFVEDMASALSDASYIREYVSDQAMFEWIIDRFEQQQEGEPLFLFGVTMQNHGGYSVKDDSYEQAVWLTDGQGDLSRVNNYLSLIHQTDKAVEYLISYFASIDEPVVIAFFGDHQPALGDDAYAQIAGGDDSSLNAQQDRYKVPFFVWANYAIEEKTVECTSLNYLSTYVYEAAGIPLPTYNRFLADMEAYIPAINANGFYSVSSQCYLPIEKASEEEKVWLQMYEQLQYNNLFDKEHRNESFFPILP